MDHIKCRVTFEDREWKVQMGSMTTVGQFTFKMRDYLKLRPEDAIFVFWKAHKWFVSDMLHPQSMTLCEIQRQSHMKILECSLLKEACFGALNRQFVKARIEQRNGVFVSIITYSWYGVYHFDTVEVHDSMVEATEFLLKERCNGALSLVAPKKE